MPKSKSSAASGLTKPELVDELSKSANLTKAQVLEVLSALRSIALRELTARKKLNIPDIVQLKPVFKEAKSASTRKIGANMVKLKSSPSHINVTAHAIKALKQSVKDGTLNAKK